MRNVYLVLKGDEQSYFTEQKNAENHAEKNGGELFEEEISEKKFNEMKKQSGFFVDMPVLEVKKNGAAKKESKKELNPDELQKELTRLKKENDQLKRNSSLSFEDAAEYYRRKAELLQKIRTFELVIEKLNPDNFDFKPTDENDLNAQYVELVLNTGSPYNRHEKLKISNVHVINDFLDFTRDKVNLKIELLKEEVQEL